MQNPHLVRKTTSPTSAPPESGIHWINTVTGEEYFSVGTSTINDWVIRKNNGTWLFGSGVPSPSLGNDNDNYLNNNNGDYYKKISGSWVLQGSLLGPVGPTGPAGPAGPAGANGADGSQIYTGTGAPSNTLGVDNDLYVDSSNKEYYHKQSGVWVSQGSFGGISDHGLLTGLNDNDHPQYLLVTDYETVQETMKEPTGFETRTTSILSFNDGTRTFSISPVALSFEFYIKGQKFTKTTAQTVVIPNTTGNHYFYFDNTGTLVSTTTLDENIFLNNVFVAIVYWNSTTSTHSYFGEERHGLIMDGMTHAYLHTVLGARYISGCALQGFTIGDGSLNSHAQFTADIGKIRDEDILHELPSQSQIPILYRIGTSWRKKVADAYPLIQSGSAGYVGAGGRIAYNQYTGGAWQLTEVTNNSFMMIHVFATNDIETPYVGVCGVAEYSTKPDAQDSANSEIASLGGMPFAEFVPVGTIIFQSSGSFTNSVKAAVQTTSDGANYVDFRGSQLFVPAGQASNHSLLANLDKDDHPQYLTQARGDLRYPLKSGDTFTGNIFATNLSGTNTGDETNATIKTKLGAATSSNDGYLTSTDWSTFNSKQSAITGAATTIVTSNLSASKALISNASGKVDVSTVTSTELSYLTGASSSIQNQLDIKFPTVGSVHYVTPVVSNTSPSAVGGVAPTATGTASAVLPTATTYYTTKKILEYTASSLSSAIAGWRFTTESIAVSSSLGVGGFKFQNGFGFQAGFASGQSNRRFFCGLTSSTVSPTDINPSTLGATQDLIGFGFDNGDANFQLMYANGTANATKINLGSSFPRPTADKANFYRVNISALAGSTTITYYIEDMITGATASGSVVSGGPGSGVLLSPRCWISAGGVASAVGVAMEYIYIES